MSKQSVFKYVSSLPVRWRIIVFLIMLFMGMGCLTRLMLMIQVSADISYDMSLFASWWWGFLYDLGVMAWFSLPIVIITILLPQKFFHQPWGRWIIQAIIWAIIFSLFFILVAEWLFWEEFGARFNFIAVDYLIYTSEVIDNIFESYPVHWLLTGVAVLSTFVYLALRPWRLFAREISAAAADPPLGKRLACGTVWCLAALVWGLILSESWLPTFANNYTRELGKNGIWSVFAAFKNNELDFDHFFTPIPVGQAFQRIHEEVQRDGSVLLDPHAKDTLRFYENPGRELRPNIIQITVESLSAKFLEDHDLTPNLAALRNKCLVFDHFYATGTRTDRGMEALTLSLPPTPGRSLIKRPQNENLFTLGSLFRLRGYDTAFIYSGYGYFDNMNAFFGNNGYRVIDRNSVDRRDITFANVWGACDEDLYRWVIREADRVHQSQTPFYFFVMTTSNHRPFTFPEGKIDLPSNSSGRQKGVKYSDYAIGEFLKAARQKPWYRNTLFVITADHCASSAGKSELPVEKYHIPLMIYAPGGQIPTGHITTLTSQIDYGPTLLGLLNWNHPSRFFGHDIRRLDPQYGHAIIGNYQKLAYIEGGNFVMLKPVKQTVFHHYDFSSATQTPIPPNPHALEETIAYYQTANYLIKNKIFRALTADEYEQYMEDSPINLLGKEGSITPLTASAQKNHLSVTALKLE